MFKSFSKTSQQNEPVVKKVSGSSPFPRQGFSLTSSEPTKEIVVFGGMRDGVPLNDISVVSVSGLWSVSASVSVVGTPPSPRVYASAVLMNSKIYVYGGLCNSRQPDDVVYCFNLDTKAWSQPRIQGQSDVVSRYGHGSAALGTKMFVLGGCGSNGFLNDTVVLDFTAGVIRWQIASTGAGHEKGKAPCPRAYHTLSAYDNKLILFGGECSYDCMGDVWEFSTTKCAWTLLHSEDAGTGPQARYHHSTVVYKNYLVVSGGQNFEGALLNDIWAFDLEQHKWYMVGNTGGDTKFEHQACLFKDKFVVLGGSKLEANLVHLLDLSKVKFSSLSPGSPRNVSKKVISHPSPPISPEVHSARSLRSSSPRVEAKESPKVETKKTANSPVPPLPLNSPPPVEDAQLKVLHQKLLQSQSQLQDAVVKQQRTQKQLEELQAEYLLVDQGNRSNSKAYEDMEQQVADMKQSQAVVEQSLAELKRSALVHADQLPDLEQRLENDSSSAVLLTVAQALKQLHSLQQGPPSNSVSEDYEVKLRQKDDQMSKLKIQFAERTAIKAENLRVLEEMNQSLQHELDQQKSQNGQLSQQIDQSGNASEQVEQKLQQAQEKQQKLEQKNQQLKDGFDQSMQVVNKIKAALEETKAELQQTKTDKDMVARQLAKNEQEFLQRNQVLEDQLKQMASKDDSLLLAKISQLEQQLQKSQADNKRLEETQSHEVALVHSVEAENVRLKSELDGITKSLKAIEQSTQLIVAERDTLKSQVDGAKEDTTQVDQLQQRINKQDIEIQQLKQQLAASPPAPIQSIVPIPPPMPTSAIPAAPPMPSSTNIPPPPPPPAVVKESGSSGNNLLAEIQAKKLKKAAENDPARANTVKAPPKLDPVAQMMAEMQAKKLLKKNATIR